MEQVVIEKKKIHVYEERKNCLRAKFRRNGTMHELKPTQKSIIK